MRAARIVVPLLTAVFVGPIGVLTATAADSSTQTSSSRQRASWVTTWAASPARHYPIDAETSVRNVVHVSRGGRAVRVTLSNRFGSEPVEFRHATVALAKDGAEARPGSLRELRFAGEPKVTVPAGEDVTSDPARLDVPDRADLLVTAYVPSAPGGSTLHANARQVSFVARGDHASDIGPDAYAETTEFRYWLTSVDVESTNAEATVVAFGDSITDGSQSTINANHRYPDFLTGRVLDADVPVSIANAGIGGNRILTDPPPDQTWRGPSALHRFDADALRLAKVRTVLFLEGVNDIMLPTPPTAKELIDAIGTLVAQGEDKGIRVICGTILPYKGYAAWTPEGERIRLEVNRAIRGGLCKGVVDFDKAIRSPEDPERIAAAYDSGDHLHPGDAGYEAMAAAVDLDLLRAVPLA